MNEQHEFIYDWNRIKRSGPLCDKAFELKDETLRDGIQSPSATDPEVDDKIELLHSMESLGVSAVSLGLPGAGPRAFSHVLALAREIGGGRMALKGTAAARTTSRDIKPIADIAQKAGVPLEVYTFIGSSPIRLYAEEWNLDVLLAKIDDAVGFAVREGLAVCLVTEDTTRSRPEILEPLFRHAISLGVRRLCLCDTVGHATPDGIHSLFEWVRALVSKINPTVKLDWHGHNDRGLATTNALFAIECGADRVHGTGLGVGERVGNASLDLMLVNLKLMQEWTHDLSALPGYCRSVARMCKVEIPYNYPVAGRDAFRTGTGVHAAAVIKAQRKGDQYLADRIYSSVPAGMFGRRQEIEVGHMSGASNVTHWLETHGMPCNEETVQAILAAAKKSNRILTDQEIVSVVERLQVTC